MVDEKKEKRRYQRIFFSIEDSIKGSFAFSDHQKGLLTANIINISEGGLGLALSKDKKDRINKGDYVILTHIMGIQGLESLTNVEAEIRWILDNPSLGFIGCGCEFLNVPESQRDAIRIFIDSWQKKTLVESSEGEHS
jgi:c-di-GMP-binding flagellar brake protein YcgR